jgi:1,4-alpha-glucan branching enzyme
MTIIPTMPLVQDESAIDAFLEARHSQPHDLLGHHLGPGGLTVTAYRPLARSVRARLQDGTVLDLPHVRGGIWSGTAAGVTATSDYRLLVAYDDGVEHEQDDPYRFAPTLGEIDRHLINEGRHEQLWTVLGSHVRSYDGPLGTVSGVSFAVWAPRASALHVIGDFNEWSGITHPMRLLGTSGLWELFVPGASEGMNYLYAIRGADGITRNHTDPMARRTEIAPKTAAIVTEAHHDWQDGEWMQRRATSNPHNGPMSVYEVHLGSWRQGLSYRDLAEHLVNYVVDLGFTHVELLPVMEHPYVPSWGYHVTGYYAPTSRFGSPDDFRFLVDRLHQNGIGVILDWVPGHFATDAWALARYDGQPLYEHPDPRKGWHPEWGSFIFDLGRNEVRNFLVANALYWLEEFHVDGLRVDGVASMLYLDYARQPGAWIPNSYGGRENLDAVRVLQEMNGTAYRRAPGIVTIAEESTSWEGVTKPTSGGGLGFGFKWNMGWMNDSLKYLAQDPVYRQYHHNSMTFALMYAFTENFVLPISHDEVVHGKGSLLRKSTGTRDEQLATLRAFLAHMWAHPGKQLIFMGCEFAQESEWADGRSLDWWLLDQPSHYRVHAQVKDMNAIYRAHREMWEYDTDPAGFIWLNADDSSHNTFSYLRFGSGNRSGDAPVMAIVVNFSGSTHEAYRIGLPRGGQWTVVLDTAGYRPEAPSSTGVVLTAEQVRWDNQPYAVSVTVPALSTVWLVPVATPVAPAAVAPAVVTSSVVPSTVVEGTVR